MRTMDRCSIFEPWKRGGESRADHEQAPYGLCFHSQSQETQNKEVESTGNCSLSLLRSPCPVAAAGVAHGASAPTAPGTPLLEDMLLHAARSLRLKSFKIQLHWKRFKCYIRLSPSWLPLSDCNCHATASLANKCSGFLDEAQACKECIHLSDSSPSA